MWLPVYLHENHKIQPNVGTYNIPYVDPIGSNSDQL